MEANVYNDTLPTWAGNDLVSNGSQQDFIMVAQNVMCAYPISDIYAPTPRYLYYSLLLLTFATLRFRWLSNIFLTGAAAYAASAAIHAFIIVSKPPTVQLPDLVSLPYVSSRSNLTNSVVSMLTDVAGLFVQPDAVELDIDPITAVVVTAYLVGLPLQIWSRTMRSSIIIRYMILLWNLCMLAGTICALIAWPSTNLAAPQYRFCYAGFQDGDSLTSDGWDASYWRGTWNSTLWNIFDNPDTVWQELSNNCLYPCFNTSQVIRQSSNLKAVVTTGTTRFAKLHNAQRETDDEFKPLIYVAIIVFSAAQFFLYIVSTLRLGSEAMRMPIHEPQRLWRYRQNIWQQLKGDMARSWTAIRSMCLRPSKFRHDPPSKSEDDQPSPSTIKSQQHSLIATLRLIIDILALLTLLAGIAISPALVVAFICWIEWYIRNDGSTNETINQVGQWSPLVSVAVVLLAAMVYQLKEKLASKDELREEIRKSELHLRRLKSRLEEKQTI